MHVCVRACVSICTHIGVYIHVYIRYICEYMYVYVYFIWPYICNIHTIHTQTQEHTNKQVIKHTHTRDTYRETRHAHEKSLCFTHTFMHVYGYIHTQICISLACNSLAQTRHYTSRHHDILQESGGRRRGTEMGARGGKREEERGSYKHHEQESTTLTL